MQSYLLSTECSKGTIKIKCYQNAEFFPRQTPNFPDFHCSTLGGAIIHLLNDSRKCRSKTQTRKTHKCAISYGSICIWKIMRSSTLTAYKWKLPNVTEWNVDPDSGKGLCKLWDTDGSQLLHICFDNITEYQNQNQNQLYSPSVCKHTRNLLWFLRSMWNMWNMIQM